MNVERRMEIERRVVRKLLELMRSAGWTAFRVFDGEETVHTNTDAEVIDTVFSVDESSIFFRKQGSDRTLAHSAVIVLGNDGWDCIANHGCSNPTNPEDDFEKIMDEQVYPYCEKIELGSA